MAVLDDAPLSGQIFRRLRFYALNANTAIDNPDQRISRTSALFTQQSLYFLLLMLGSVLQLIAFSEVLWSISRELVVFLVLYAIFGTVVSVLCFGKVLIGLNFYQLKREADFRFSLIRVREHAESITFHRGEQHGIGSCTRQVPACVRQLQPLDPLAVEPLSVPVCLCIPDPDVAQRHRRRPRAGWRTRSRQRDPGRGRVRRRTGGADGDRR
ncbi:hypothetical protein ACTMU2_09765 [Cupriavidus basilensis]